MNKKITLTPAQEDDETRYKLTPKGAFRRWCWEHGKELVEMTTELDFEMFDRMWPQIADIFKLDYAGNHARPMR